MARPRPAAGSKEWEAVARHIPALPEEMSMTIEQRTTNDGLAIAVTYYFMDRAFLREEDLLSYMKEYYANHPDEADEERRRFENWATRLQNLVTMTENAKI